MADAHEAQTGAAGAAPAAGGGRSKRIIIIVMAGLLLIGLGGGAAYFLTGPGSGEAAAAKGDHGTSESDADHSAGSESEGGIVALDSFVVNLAEENAQRYLKVTMKLEFFQEVPQSFNSRRPQIRDLLLTLLSSKTVDAVRTAEGKQQLRDEIIARVNRVLKDDLVKAVYFAEFIVQ